MVFEETRNTPFLDGDSSNYFCSIVRFSIQAGSSLPVFIPRIGASQPDPNPTVYKITLVYQSHKVTENITYVPPISQEVDYYKVGLLGGQNTTSYANSIYYYVKNYQDFIEMINLFFNLCVNKLATKAGVALNATRAPILELDPNSLKCILNADLAFYDDSLNINAVEIFFNSRLFELFTSFRNIFYGYNGNLNYKLVVHNNNGLNLNKITNTRVVAGVPSTTTYTYVQMYQEVSTVSLWNPIASLVF